MNNILPLLIFCCSAMISPGPNNLMLMNSATNFGVRRTIPHYLGVCLGSPVLFFFVAIGLGAVFTQYTWIKPMLMVLGVTYIIYLAWQIAQPITSDATIKTIRKPLTFLQAASFQWVNPKAWIMAISITSIFSFSDHFLINAICISMLLFFVCLPCGGVWLWLGKQLTRIFRKDTHRLRFNQAMAIFLIASVVYPMIRILL